MADLTEYSPKSTAHPSQLRSAFGPFLLVALSVITVLTWQVLKAYQGYEQGQLLQQQRTKLVEQSRAVQTRLQKFLHGLIDLSATDADAKAIVTKFDISLDKSGVSTKSTPTPSVQTSPAP